MCGNRCCSKQGFNKGSWSATEDTILADYVRTHGEGKWGEVPKRAGLHRCPRSCRLRWLNYLRPDIKRGNISLDEEDLIIRLHNLLGNRWSLIAGRLPGRTDNEIKNYWNTVLKKKVQAQPVTSMNPLRSDKDGDTKRKSRKRIRRPGLDNSTSCNEEASVSHQHDDRNAPVKEFEESLVSTGDILFDISFSEPEDFDLFSPLMGSELCPRHLLDLDFFETSGSNLQKDIRNWSNSPVSFDDNEFFSKGVSDTWFDGDSSQPYGGMNLESPTTFFQSESEYPSLWKGMV